MEIKELNIKRSKKILMYNLCSHTVVLPGIIKISVGLLTRRFIVFCVSAVQSKVCHSNNAFKNFLLFSQNSSMQV